METDFDGVYEAHIVTSDGQELIVQMGKDFVVTGTDSGGARAGCAARAIQDHRDRHQDALCLADDRSGGIVRPDDRDRAAPAERRVARQQR